MKFLHTRLKDRKYEQNYIIRKTITGQAVRNYDNILPCTIQLDNRRDYPILLWTIDKIDSTYVYYLYLYNKDTDELTPYAEIHNTNGEMSVIEKITCNIEYYNTLYDILQQQLYYLSDRVENKHCVEKAPIVFERRNK